MEGAIETSLNKGAKKAPELQAELRISQPTLSRTLTHLEKTRRVIRLGSARSTRYAALRISAPLRQASYPLYEVGENGEAKHVASLATIAPRHFAVLPPKNAAKPNFPVAEEISAALPYYLQPMRPEGFLGRLIAAGAARNLQLPTDARQWSEDEVLLFATQLGSDLPGAFIVGEESMRRHLTQRAALSVDNEADVFLDAVRLLETENPPGSSAGGEQPKFTSLIRDSEGQPMHVLVKFSRADNDAAAERWRDLLIAEHIALSTLRAAGVNASHSRIAEYAGRVHLVVERFDRVGLTGRRHYVPFGAIDDALIGERRHVCASAAHLQQMNLISEQDLGTIQLVSLFGEAIGNTDQHFGNTSFTCTPAGFALAPVYDVLPMWYAPQSQGGMQQGLHPQLVILPEFYHLRDRVLALAKTFWQQVHDHARVSPGFREIGGKNLERLC